MANNKDFKVKNGIQPTVYHEGLGTVTSGSAGYSLANGVFDSINFSVASQIGDERGLRFSADGTKFYVLDGNSPQSIYQYTLSTAWDLSTASYSSKSFDISSQETQPTGVSFKSDGTKMYIIGYTGDDVNEYTLSTAWDVSTASYVQSFSVSAQFGLPTDIYFKTDGTSFYVAGSPTSVFQYNLSTAWDISTASYSGNSVSTSEMWGLAFNSDGTAFYVVGNSNNTVYEYTLTTAWDVSTASASGQSFSVSAQDTVPYGLDFKSDGTKMYVLGAIGTDVNQYSTSLTTNTLDLSTGSVFEITPTSDIQINLSNPADSGTVSQATLLLDGGSSVGYDLANGAYSNNFVDTSSVTTSAKKSEFSADGTKLYITNATTVDVDIYQYDLTTAYDVSTATYNSVSFDPTTQSAAIQGFRFKSDGTKMYVLGTTNDTVYQYSLSTAWDISTASYDSVSLSISAQDSIPQDITFKTDGTAMYLIGTSSDAMYQYTLSTAWDLSTASYASKTASVATQTTGPDSFDIKTDGTKVFVLDNDTVYQYSLSTAWDISTASYDSVTFDASAQESAMRGIRFKPDGRKMYLTGDVEDRVYEYNTGTPATITYDSTLEFAGGTAPTSPAIGETDVITISTRDGGTTYQAVQAIDGAS